MLVAASVLLSTLSLAVLCPPERLRVEYEAAPLGLDVKVPRFSWALCTDGTMTRGVVQAAYSLEVIDVNQNKTIWSSGTTVSNRSTNVRFGATAQLPADGAYTWRVQWWSDTKAAPSPWSHAATFTTGLYAAADWKGAEWITMATGKVSPDHVLLRSPAFKLPAGKTVQRASAYIVGLGYYHLYLDGAKVSTHLLGAFTTFEKRVLYDTWDATDLLTATASAEHVLAVEIGPGYYTQKTVNPNRVKLCRVRLSIKFTDGTDMDVTTSSSAAGGAGWVVAQGPITHTDIYDGEYVDMRLNDDTWKDITHSSSSVLKWQAADAAGPPENTTLVTSHAVLPKIGIRETYSPIAMYESAPGEYVYDFGQNMAGLVTFKIPAGVAGPESAGTTVSMLHAEAVHGPPPAKIYHHYGNTAELVNITLAGDGAAVDYTPKFTYMGFRYVRLTGYPGVPTFETITAHFLNTMYDLIGDISFSDPNLNAVQHITRMAAMSNFMSIPTDCPQRERRGWLGDAQLSSRTNTFNFGMAGAYTHFVGQIQDAQTDDGATQDCVPWYHHGHQPADPAWGSAYTFLAELIFEQYDDDDVVGLRYDGVKAHIDSLTKQAVVDNDQGLLDFSWWGDWCPPSGCRMEHNHANSRLVSSFEYISQLRMIARFASILGHTDDAAMYAALDKKVSAQFVERFYVPENKTFFEPNRPAGAEELTVQTCISLASSLGLVPEEDSAAVFDTLVEDVMVKNGGHLDVGIVGVKELLPALVAGGRSDVALQVAQTPDAPGWVYMVLQGATTLWETWTGTRYAPVASWNHIMFGSQSAWYFESLAGIQLAPGARGWQRLLFKPAVWAGAASPPRSLCGNLSYVDASVDTIRGRAAAAWKCPSASSTSSTCASDVAEKDVAHLECEKAGATITSVVFASYGTPVGSCMSPSTFAIGKCGANVTKQTIAVVEKDCVGKASCDITVSSQTFGGDPCFGTKKFLDVEIKCSGGTGPTAAALQFTYTVTVPSGSTASVVLPTFGAKSSDTLLTVNEGGVAVWAKGAFVGSSVDGVVSAAAGSDLSGPNVAVEVGSGTYTFTVFAP